MNQAQIISFAAATVLIVAFSWFASIKRGRYHGIYRFFAFESIALMAILNSRYWFLDQQSITHLISWFFLFVSIPVAIGGFWLLISLGRPKKIADFEATTKLVTTGMFRYIRHPLYCSLLLLGFGIFFKHVALLQTGLVAVNTVALFLTARAEEGEMIKGFGREYRQYMKKTKMFIPYII